MATTKNKKPIPKGKSGEGLRKLKKKAPIVVAKMGYKKKGGIVRRASGSPPSGESKLKDELLGAQYTERELADFLKSSSLKQKMSIQKKLKDVLGAQYTENDLARFKKSLKPKRK